LPHYGTTAIFFLNAPPTTAIYTLSLHDALPILEVETIADQRAVPTDPRLTERLAAAVAASGHPPQRLVSGAGHDAVVMAEICPRSEEHTSELQSRFDLVCRLLLEKKKTNNRLR